MSLMSSEVLSTLSISSLTDTTATEGSPEIITYVEADIQKEGRIVLSARLLFDMSLDTSASVLPGTINSISSPEVTFSRRIARR